MDGKLREICLLGLGESPRGDLIASWLEEAGYHVKRCPLDGLASQGAMGMVLDLSPSAEDPWGTLIKIKKTPELRDTPVLPVYLSEDGKVGAVFPVAGFFVLPLDTAYLDKKLTSLGLTEDTEMYDLRTMIISPRGDESVAKALEGLGFEIDNAYTGKEGLALATLEPPYIAFVTLSLSDMTAFELLEKIRLYPQVRNMPFFVLLKDNLKVEEKKALSKEIAGLVRKKELTKEEFLAVFRRR